MLLSVALAASFVFHVHANLLQISVDPETQRLVDSVGREVLIHGTNIVIKEFPWHPKTKGFAQDTFSEEDMKFMKSLGLNGVRLGMMWPGLVPKKGEFNETYLKIMVDLVTKAEEYGIYILLDMHQDVMSHRFCVEGFPDWTIDPEIAKSFPFPLHEPYKLDPTTNLPSSADCSRFSWATYYLTEAVGQSFENLYTNVNGLRDEWAKFWVKTAQTFKSHTNVMGYELLNEPWAGNVYRNPALLLPTVADKRNLAPAYDALAKAIRAVDDKHCIFFEPVTWDDFGVGFKKVPGGDAYQNRSVLSYHYYIPPDFNANLNFDVRIHDLEKLKCGGMLTEFATHTESSAEEMFKVMRDADLTFQSWLGWEYYGSKRTTSQSPIARIYNTSRTYPQAVAGHVLDLNFDHNTNHFRVMYQISEKCRSDTTVIYLNEKRHYPNGYDVIVKSTGHVTWSSKVPNYVVVQHSATLKPGDNVLVHIIPKPSESNKWRARV
ncbi:endoglycoceramidase-like [Paramuricea clavata]|uniref:Endoglycoceramidase-like n=1 Tax=Paramuricea clavata TaxID=317549 RepID=A0A7D9DRW5_PARCT|nr:endoglycoceramidase-like [Paramuricea clavata]